MLRKILALVGLALMTTVPVAAHAARTAEPIVLAPTTPWTLDYGEDACSLRRAFGTGDHETRLEFQALQPGASMRLAMAGKLFRAGSPTYDFKLRFGPANLGETTGEAMAGLTNDREPFLRMGTITVNASWTPPRLGKNQTFEEWRAISAAWPVPSAETIAAEERSTSELHFEQKGGPKLLLQTGQLAPPLHSLRQCVEALVRSWGLDPEVQQHLSVRPEPVGSPGDWLNTNDYPIDMWRTGQGAVVHFRIIIDADGSPLSCAVQAAAGPKKLRDLTCTLLMSRAKFSPAHDATGVPVKSYWLSSAKWGTPAAF